MAVAPNAVIAINWFSHLSSRSTWRNGSRTRADSRRGACFWVKVNIQQLWGVLRIVTSV